MSSLFKTIVLVCTALSIFSSCSIKEKGFDKALIKGTWHGSASYKLISEYKVYSLQLEDSLTKHIDTMIVIHDILLDVSKDEARFYGFNDISSAPYKYHWDEDRLAFQKGIPANMNIESESFSIKPYLYHPSSDIIKLDADSLVMNLSVYTDKWNEYLFKLKRK